VVVKFACALPQHCGGVASKAARQSVARAAWSIEHEIGCTAPEWELAPPDGNETWLILWPESLNKCKNLVQKPTDSELRKLRLTGRSHESLLAIVLISIISVIITV
jgi:hypothetical protein